MVVMGGMLVLVDVVGYWLVSMLILVMVVVVVLVVLGVFMVFLVVVM